MDRREFLKLTGGAAMLGIGFTARGGHPVWAQGPTPLADLGLPELVVTLSEAGFQVTPSETPAGWTSVTFENTLAQDNFNSADLMLLVEGLTIDDVMNLVATPTTGAPPAWVYETTWAGGPTGGGGTTTQAVVNLAAGDWMVWSAGEGYAAAALTVTEASEATPAPPSLTADVEVEMQDHAFVGLEQTVPAGPHIWNVVTSGEQPHVMVLFSVPEGTTTEQLLAGFSALMTGTPAADALELERVQPAGGCANLSAGQTAWHSLDLAAGTYGAVCFVQDQETGAPHVLLGMGTAFTVA